MHQHKLNSKSIDIWRNWFLFSFGSEGFGMYFPTYPTKQQAQASIARCRLVPHPLNTDRPRMSHRWFCRAVEDNTRYLNADTCLPITKVLTRAYQ